MDEWNALRLQIAHFIQKAFPVDLIERLKNMSAEERLKRTEWLQNEKSKTLCMDMYVGLNHFTDPDWELLSLKVIEMKHVDRTLFDKFTQCIKISEYTKNE